MLLSFLVLFLLFVGAVAVADDHVVVMLLIRSSAAVNTVFHCLVVVIALGRQKKLYAVKLGKASGMIYIEKLLLSDRECRT